MRKITDTYFVSPQIDPQDMAALVAVGVTTLIDNRPDAEIPPSHHADVMKTAAEAAGLRFVHLPVTHQTMTPEVISQQIAAITDSEEKTLAYCASGTRSTVLWCMGQATSGTPVDDILAAAARGGYDLEQLRPTLEQMAAG